MASSPKSRGLGNISPIVNRSGITSPVKPVAKMPVPKPVTTTFAQRKAAPSPFRSQAKPMAKVNPLQAQYNQMKNVPFAPPPGGIQYTPFNPQPMMPPSSGLNQMQQDYFKYRNSQRDIEEQNQQASQAYQSRRGQAIKDAGYGTGSAQYGHYDEVKDAAALQFIRDYDAANPMAKEQEYDMGYDDFQSYAQKKLGFRAQDPNNPNNVNGYNNLDLGLMDVRRNPGMLTYVPNREGYQDKQGNYYDTRGNPMARPKFLDEEANNPNPGQQPFDINQMFNPNSGPKYSMPNAMDYPAMQGPGGGMFGGNLPGMVGNAVGQGMQGLGQMFEMPGEIRPISDHWNVGQDVRSRLVQGPNGFTDPVTGKAYSIQGNEQGPGGFDFMNQNQGQLQQMFGNTATQSNLMPTQQNFGMSGTIGNSMAPGMYGMNPQDNNDYNTGGFMGGGGGSLFGGGGFAGK